MNVKRLALQLLRDNTGLPSLWVHLRQVQFEAGLLPEACPKFCVYGKAAAWKQIIANYITGLWPTALVSVAGDNWNRCPHGGEFALWNFDFAVQTTLWTITRNGLGRDTAAVHVLKSRWTLCDPKDLYRVDWPDEWRAHI